MKIVYIDMDGPLADFSKGVGRPFARDSDPPEMFEKYFFRSLPVVPGAQEAVAQLLANPELDVYIASKPTVANLYSTIEKYQWVEEHFPSLFKKIFLTCDKGHLNGHYLIDDDRAKWEHKFKGKFLWFNEQFPFYSWLSILNTLDKENS